MLNKMPYCLKAVSNVYKHKGIKINEKQKTKCLVYWMYHKHTSLLQILLQLAVLHIDPNNLQYVRIIRMRENHVLLRRVQNVNLSKVKMF